MKSDFPNVNTFLPARTGRPIQEIEAEFFADFDAKFLDRKLTGAEADEAAAALKRVISELGG